MTRGMRLIGIRPGEGRTMALVAASFAALEAGRGFGEIGVDTLVLSRFGAGVLPYLFVALGATSLWRRSPTALRSAGCRGSACWSGLPLGAAAVLVVEFGLTATDHPAVLALTWLTVYAVGAIALTIVWTMAGAVFDSRQARRLFPLCTGGGDCRQLLRDVARRAGRPVDRYGVAGPARSCPARCARARHRRRVADHDGPDARPGAATSRSWPTCG